MNGRMLFGLYRTRRIKLTGFDGLNVTLKIACSDKVGTAFRLFDPDSILPSVREGSDAWKFMEQLLNLKIKNGNGTDQNKQDLQYMQGQDKAGQKKPN